ncbi:MAG: glutamate--tRNA ligase [Beijerinckiaceae bacterium]|nr:glutamate--tRNA ligase [Beijerinckiaceae bacterium]
MPDPKTKPVITRFAPSPTGFLHIGGARTALFNWLYARHTGGKMLLRIEDTDRERSTEAAIAAIIDGLDWLGLHHDGEITYQYARKDRHAEVARHLLSEGKAYHCYATAEELAEMRETARKEGRPPRYDGRWRDRDPSEAPKDVKPVIRLRAPQDGETVVDDAVQGRVTWANKDLDDLVLLRSDGGPTYMLAVVVDDHDMDVTHIIRGDDHLTNAARQTQIYQALGWSVPSMSHIPLIHGPDGAKLSKRHGALGVEAYRAMGYLPEALRNYLVRLGWSQGDTEFFTTDEMIAAFDLKGIGRSAARFDFVKLENVNGHYMRAADDARLIDAIDTVLDHIDSGSAIKAKLDDAMRAKLLAAMPGLKERAKTVIELIEGAAFLFADRPLQMEEKAEQLLADGGRARLDLLIPALEAATEWTAAALEQVVRTASETQGVKLGQLAQPLRAALTGRLSSPGIFDVLEVLGRDESLARLKDQAEG